MSALPIIRLIPVLFIKNGLIVRSQHFQKHQIIGNVISQAKRLNDWNVDELVYIDISRDKKYDARRDDVMIKSIDNILDMIRAISKVCFMPLSFGGNIRSVEDAVARIRNGADKIICNHLLFNQSDVLKEIIKTLGSQAVVGSIDYKIINGKAQVFKNFGTIAENMNLVEVAQRCEDIGVGELFVQNIDLDKIYSTVYNELSYKNDIQNNYKQILSYHYSNSDNKHRVERIINYFKLREKSLIGLEVLDVGSGLCVFLGELKKYGTRLHCVDPSRVSIDHAIKNVGVDSAFEGEFLDLNTNRKYDLITFNKVLEHVKNPKDLVLKAKGLLKKDGTIYIELPDGKKSSYNGGFIDREEFYLEHYTIFTKKAIRYLAESTMLNVNVIKQIHEPSDKYTIYSFLNNSNY